ncbi:MAG: SpoIIE family protein phosphatase [Promicromonosporaceae bacterium]|nr:SpoIIE family protein phosphatase [Promicromonosporaceae bacterium]
MVKGSAAGQVLPDGFSVWDLVAELADVTTIGMFLVGSPAEGLPLLWTNHAFERHTGLSPGAKPLGDSAEIAALGPVVRVLADPAAALALEPALTSGKGGTFSLRCKNVAGKMFWADVTLTPRHDSVGRVTHILGQAVDVSHYVKEQSDQRRSLALERRQRTDLSLIAEATDLLSDLEHPRALRDVAELLQALVPWAAFYINDDGLLFAEGIAVTAMSDGRAGRHTRYMRDIEGIAPRRPGKGDATAASPTNPQARDAEVVDAVQDLLDGIVDGPVLLRLNVEYPAFSASGWLCHDLLRRMKADLGSTPEAVQVHAVAGRRQVMGLLITAEAEGDNDDARTVIEMVARRTGTAIDNARLYAREYKLAEALQRAMLPEQADVVGLDVWTYYAPSSMHSQVGGDWYDVLDIDGGAVGIVIGDVVGHDVEAAASMGQIRSVVRSCAVAQTTPGAMLDRVDHLVKGMRIPRSASLVFASVQRTGDDDPWRLEYTRAGHLPPLLLRDGVVHSLDGGGGALVGFSLAERPTASDTLRPGDVLVFYTDGLVERRNRPMKDGFDQLLRIAGNIAVRDSAGIGEELLSRMVDIPEDDVAIVVVRVPNPEEDDEDPPLSPRSRRWALPSEPASIGRARQAVIRSCKAWGLAESASAELVVSELVANGVLHGWGSVELRLFDTDDGLRIEVEDANPAPPITTDGHPNKVGGFGMQIVERLADWGWRPAGSGKIVWAKIRPQASTPTRSASM